MKKLILLLLTVSLYSTIYAQEQEVEVSHIMEERYIYLQEINGYEENTIVLDDSKYLVFSSLDEAKSYLSNITRGDVDGRDLSLNNIFIYTKTGREESFTTSIVLAEKK